MIARLTRIIVCCIAGSLIAGGSRQAAGQALPAALLSELKSAAVYVKVNRRNLEWTGSGFVILKHKEVVLIVTGSHVLDPPKVHGPDDAKGLSPSVSKQILELQKQVGGIPSTVHVVFFSGTREEQVLSAEVVARDTIHDLAVLKVAGAFDGVKPILMNTEAIPETTQLFGLGFPFGGMMSENRINPTITVTRVELTSYKPVSDDMALLQLQGPLNPGSSGGPVVDMHGKLCGVQIRTIYGSGLGFAVPTDQVVRTLQGRLLNWRMAAKKDDAGKYDVEYRVQVIDPLHRLGDLELHYLPRAAAQVSPAEFTASANPPSGAKTVALKRDGQWASGTFKISLAGPGPLVVTVQPTWTEGGKQGHAGRPEVVRIRVDAAAPASADDGRTFWRYVDKKKGEGWFTKTAAGWDEEDEGGRQHFSEVGRTPDLIELLDAKHGVRIHLHHDKLAFRFNHQRVWTILHTGAWEAAGTVAAAK